MSEKIIVGYWNTPGKAQPSRYLLELSGIKYEEVRYSYPAVEWFKGQGNDKYIVDNLRNLFSDIGARMYIQSQKEGKTKTQLYNEQILPKIRYINKFLGQKECLLGYFTAADLYFLCFARSFKDTLSDYYNEFALTFDLLTSRIESIPQIAKYISEGRHP
ncbi:hypothetical protein ABPG72_004890 [Tetrahymena utriculariae]